MGNQDSGHSSPSQLSTDIFPSGVVTLKTLGRWPQILKQPQGCI